MASNGFASYATPEASRAQVQMKSRELLVEERMHGRLKDYVNMKPYNFFVGTWNVNGHLPKEHDLLDPWLICDGPVHFYVIGFQELDLDKRAYVLETSIREAEWRKAIERTLKRKGSYKPVKIIRLVGIMLLVYVLKEEESYIKNISAAMVGTGIMGWMGNKGGVAVRLDFHGTELCFVTAHFAAHTEEVERRNEDFRNICEKMTFIERLQYPKKIKDHDIVLWCGDFNYRIAGKIRKEVEDLISGNKIAELFLLDQLKHQMEQKKVFHDFYEGSINFRPTYKYDTGTDRWDSSEKSRVPSWCDRVLWKTKVVEEVKLLHYDSRMQMLISDHKPVVALFEVSIKVIDEKRRKKVYEEVLKNIDREENSLIPQAVVDRYEIQFGDVTFIQPVKDILTLANTGQVPVIFEFIGKLNNEAYCKDWLKISPQRSMISPGDAAHIELQIEVDKKTVGKLTTKEEKLDDILVLHLDGGKDFFITVQGNYLPSCFGTSLEIAAASSTPIRSSIVAEVAPLIDFGFDSSSPSVQAVERFPAPPDVPVEIWMMMVQLHISSADVPDLFLQPGLPEEVEKVRDHLDARLPLPIPGSGHSVAEALLLYLDALPDPLVPYAFFEKCLEAAPSAQQCRTVLDQFPRVHKATFRVFIVLLRELQKHWLRHPTSDEGTLEVIADLIIKAPPDNFTTAIHGTLSRPAIKQLQSKKKTQFLQQLLFNKLPDEPVLPKSFNEADNLIFR